MLGSQATEILFILKVISNAACSRKPSWVYYSLSISCDLPLCHTLLKHLALARDPERNQFESVRGDPVSAFMRETVLGEKKFKTSSE